MRPPGGARQFLSVLRLVGFLYFGRASFKMFAHLRPTKILITSFLTLFILLLRRGAPLGWELRNEGDFIYSTSTDLLLGGRSEARWH